MSILSKTSPFLRRALVLTVAIGSGAVVMNAQTADDTAPAKLNTSVPAYSSSATFSTSADAQPANVNLAMNVKPFNAMNAMQYGSGSRSGAPRYRGGNSNADGSSRWIFYGGA